MISRRGFLGRLLAAFVATPMILRPTRKLGAARQLLKPGIQFVPMSAIRVDESLMSRNRCVLGENYYYDGLVESIRQEGLLNPITIRDDGVVIDGFRRVRACNQLGHKQIAARVLTREQWVQWKNFTFAQRWGGPIMKNPCGEIPLIYDI